MIERLQKILAHAGLCSRRAAEAWIAAGRVAVDGHVIQELGAKADPSRQQVTVDGRPLRRPEPPRYFLFNKPGGVVATLSDPEGRPSLANYLPRGRKGIHERVYPVGRLDFHSEGLLLLTNDGRLAHRVLHASAQVPKTYWVKVSGRPSEEKLERLRRGVMLPATTRRAAKDGGMVRGARAVRTAPARIRPLPGRGGAANPWFEVILIEGRQNQIRRMFRLVGHPVEKLNRVKIGPLTLGALRPGELRPLTVAELQALRRLGAEPGRERRA
ncbi:MAG: pseudouridine synthase [Terriglobales bacterium]